MATNLRTIRSIDITDGKEVRTATIYQADEGVFLRDSGDMCFDSLVQIADDSDTSIADVIRESGFEIA